MPEVAIRVSNLSKRYGSLTAVDGISFEVNDNEIFGLLGPNGAGKTTTLEIIETLRQKSGGEVEVFGFSVDADAESIKQSIGVQLQQSGYYPNLTLAEILRLFADLYNSNDDPIGLLEIVNLKDRAGSKYKELSGGQKQRFSICTTLVHQPKIIFLDEPSTGLDPKARRSLWSLVQGIRKNGATVVLTTHYMDEAEVLCDRVAIMNKGKIVAIDTPNKMIDDLLSTGFKREREVKEANLEDVFLHLTGEALGEEEKGDE